MKNCFLVTLFIFSITFISAQTDTISKKDSTKTKNFRIAGYPTGSYSTETSWAVGGYLATTFRLQGQGLETTPSQVSLTAQYTGLKQVIFYLPFQFFSKNDDFLLKGELGYFRYFYRFFGVGNELPLSNDEFYKVHFPRVRLYPLKRINKTTLVGFNYAYDGFNIVEKDSNGLLVKDSLVGSNGGILSGIGPSFRYDSRDNFYFPTKGLYFDFNATFHTPFLGATFNYGKIEYDVSTYLEDKVKNVWAFNYYGGFNTGIPPLNDMMELGGSRRSRGIFRGRYRDRVIQVLQAEYRYKIWKRFGGVAFASYGGVGRSFDKLKLNYFKFNYGLGLRYALDPAAKINLRLDVAGFDYAPSGKWLPGIYIVLGEAF